MPKMKIGIEGSALATKKPTGIARYASNLLRAINELGNQFDLFYSYSKCKHLKYIPIFNCKKRMYVGNVIPLNKKVDIIHGLDNKLPNWKDVKKIITIHDLLIMNSDSERISPKNFREKKIKELNDVFNHVDGVITVSESTKRDVIKHFNFPKDKIFVTHLGVDSAFSNTSRISIEIVKEIYNLDRPYLLFVGAISGRKNTENLVRAFHESKLYEDFDLVLAGPISYMGESTLTTINELNLCESVKLLNYIHDDHLTCLYQNARAFVFPTMYEGFGLPIIEAMISKTPVLSSVTGSAPEILKDYGVLVDPASIESIAKGMREVLDIDNEQIHRAFEYAKTFTWKRCAEQTINAYAEIAKL